MQLWTISLISLCSVVGLWAQDTNPKELELTSLHILAEYPHRFDLSGIVADGKNHWVVGDKKWNQYAYRIAVDSNQWYLTDSIKLGLRNNSDLEGIDFCQQSGLYFIDEKFNRAYHLNREGKSQVIFNKGILREGLKWGTNSGLEGIAVDCENNILYLAKERQPRFVVVYDLCKEKVVDRFNLSTEEGDISDLKYENGFLYLLERNDNYITKINTVTKQIVDRVSYKSVCSHPEGKLYGPSEYGLAEALLLTPTEIWLGLDNNGLEFTPHARKKYGLEGNQPLLLKFERPPGF